MDGKNGFEPLSATSEAACLPVSDFPSNGCETWIRTKIASSKGSRTAVVRSRNMVNVARFERRLDGGEDGTRTHEGSFHLGGLANRCNSRYATSPEWKKAEESNPEDFTPRAVFKTVYAHACRLP
jgi:hypothetical protein